MNKNPYELLAIACGLTLFLYSATRADDVADYIKRCEEQRTEVLKDAKEAERKTLNEIELTQNTSNDRKKLNELATYLKLVRDDIKRFGDPKKPFYISISKGAKAGDIGSITGEIQAVDRTADGILIVKWDRGRAPAGYIDVRYYAMKPDKVWKLGQSRPLSGVYRCTDTFIHEGETVRVIEPVKLPK